MFRMGKEGKSGRKRIRIVVVCIGIVVIFGTAGTAIYRQKHQAPEQETDKVNEVEVTRNTISDTIVGTGNLEMDEAEAIMVPSGITIEEVLAESGDYVSAGTVLATVDKASVLSAVEDIQEELKDLDEEISQCQDDDDENVVTSSVSGRVKAVYVEENSDVTEVMLDKGALMVLSLDGLMEADMEGECSCGEGTQVNVELEDGTVVVGTVESSDENTWTVTISDEYSEPGEQVSVTDSEGKLLGSSQLYIHEPLEITGTTGTVSEVSVSLDTQVDADTELLVLEGTESDGEYEELLAVREARTATLKKLLQLAASPQITAEFDGTVQDVNVAESGDVSGEDPGSSSGDSGVASQMSYRKVIQTSQTFTSGDQEALFSSAAPAAAGVEKENTESTSQDTIQEQKIMLSVSGTGESGSICLVIPVPETGGTPVTQIIATDGSYSGVVVWNPGDSAFAAGTSYQALVALQASDGYYFGTDSIQGIETGTISGIQVSEDCKTLEFQIAFPATAEEPEVTVITDEPGNDENGQNAEFSDEETQETSTQSDETKVSENITENSRTETETGTKTGGNAEGDTQPVSVASAGESTKNSDSAVQTSDAAATESAASADSTDASSQYTTDVSAFTVCPDEYMILSVSVDELDINSVEVGQNAEITFDAIEDKTFQGQITKIGNSASVSGGVAKYSVELSVPKDEQMKEGMNASAEITIEEREQVLTLPVNALQEQGDRTFVYTEKEEDGSLSGETEITTGLSDGNTVEITGGLEEGDVVYYMRTGASSGNSDSGQTSRDRGNPGGDFGEMPDMGDFSGGMPEMNGGQRGGGPGMQE